MSMQTATSPVAEWFVNLPLSDPRCRNDSCAAFKNGHTASQAAVSYYHQYDYGHYVVWIYTGLIGIYFVLFILNLILALKPRPMTGSPGLVQKAKATFRSFTYRRIPGPIGGYLALPSFGITALIVLLVVATFIMSFIEHPFYRQFRGYGSPPLGVRTGLMAAAMIPLCVALSGKVNLVTLLTGVSHEKLNTIHRWAGWIMFIIATLHTIPFFLQEHREGIVHSKFYTIGAYEYSGTPGYAFSFGLVALSVPIIRRKVYEIFFWSHYLMAIVFLGLMFWHFGNEGDSWAYLYATVAVWGFNILGRWFWGSSAFKVSEGWLTGCPTTIELCADNVLRIEVLVPNHWTWRAGQHVFLRIPKLNPFDNHPFTIASLPSLGIDSEKFQRGNDNIMVFLTRSYSGGTGRLLNYVKENSDVQLFTFIEGPYGSRLPRFEHLAENVILVAGGVGVSAVLPLFVHISRVMAEPRNTYVTSSLKLIWMVRHASDFGWVHREVQAAIAQVSELQVSVALYITRETKKEAGAEIAGLKNDDKVATTFEDSRSDVSVDGVTIHVSGRPRLGELVPELVGEGRTAVVGCGPEGLKIDLSNAVANLQRRVLKGQSQDVALYTESFDW